MVFTAPMSCRSHSINNINIIRIFAWEIRYCMQLVIERAKGALCLVVLKWQGSWNLI